MIDTIALYKNSLNFLTRPTEKGLRRFWKRRIVYGARLKSCSVHSFTYFYTHSQGFCYVRRIWINEDLIKLVLVSRPNFEWLFSSDNSIKNIHGHF